MVKPELYKKTVDILVDAYFADTLRHENCYACAVGNIIAGNCGFKYALLSTDEEMDENCRLYWEGFNSYKKNPNDSAVYLVHSANVNTTLPDSFSNELIKQIEATGYSFRELQIIEDAFENAPYGYSPEDFMFNGLTFVIDALDQIHQNKDQSISNSSKQRFKKELVKI